MKDETKRAKLVALLGLEAPTNLTGPKPQTLKDTRSREAEAVIAFVTEPQRFARVTCRTCGRDFAVNRANVSQCSDQCRAKELDKLGIQWDWSKDPSTRWYVVSQHGKSTNEPLVIPSEAIQAFETASLLWKKISEVPSFNEGNFD